MAILVTGGTGFIGSHTVVELLQAGYEVVIADNLYNSKAMVVDRIEAITGKRPTFYELDVCDKPALDALFDKEKIDAVIHFAGYKAVGESTRKPIEYYENNLGSTLTLCKSMREHDCFLRRDQVHAGEDPHGCLESGQPLESHAASLF